jgi:hypothetical protein
VVAGQEEHLNWLKLMRFISTTVPQPNASNLSANAKAAYFDTAPAPEDLKKGAMSGKRAYEELLARQVGGAKKAPVPMDPMMGGPMPPAQAAFSDDELGTGIDDLIQFDIEGIDCRYSPNLAAVWKQIRTKVREAGDVSPPEQFDKPPEGKGWVVEIRGYTFHRGKRRFLRDTFLQNIYRIGMPDFGKAPAPMTPGGTTPAAPAATQPTDAVIGQISHVVLYDAQTEQTADSHNFKVIGSGIVDRLVKEAAAGTGTGVPGGPGVPGGDMTPKPLTGGDPNLSGGAAGGSGRDSWVPLSGAGGTGPGGPGGPPFGPGPMNPAGGPMAGAGTSSHTRTEFIILFFWKEKTPSDSLRGQPEEGTAPSGSPTIPGGPTPRS